MEHEQPESVSFYLRPTVRQRSRAAYQATKDVERDHSWSDFIEKAIVAELLRRESVHNDGEHFSGGSANLTPGRRPQGERPAGPVG